MSRGWVWLAVLVLGCEPKPGSRETIEPEPPDAAAACDGAEALARAWSSSRQAELHDALAQLPGEWPQQAFDSLAAKFAEHGEPWRLAYAQACTRDDEALMACLDGQARQLDALISLIIEQRSRAAALWVQLDRSVASPRRCERRGGQSPAQLQPDLAGKLVRLELLVELGDHAAAAALLGGLEADRELREAPELALRLAVARVAVELGEGRLELARHALDRAAELAGELGPREHITLARAQARVAAAEGELELAAATLDRALVLARSEADPELELELLRELGSMFVDHRQPARALERLTEAVALSSRLGRADNPVTAELQTILAEAQLELGHIEAAHDSLTQARDGFVITLGPDHPQTLATVEAIGRSFIAAGLLGDAQFAFLDLLEVYTDLYGAKHWRTALVKLELGDSLMAMDQHDGARKLYSEALVPLIEGLGPGHRAVVRTAIHLGIAELALGNLDAAEPHCARGRDLAKGLATGDPLADEAERCLAQLSAAKRKRPR